MHSEFDDFNSPLDVERLIFDSLKEILRHEDPVKFLQWLQEHITDYDNGQYPELDRSTQTYTALAASIGRSIWNATPLPGNNFDTNPLPEVKDNDMCYCGSGRKFKHCCANLPVEPTMQSEELWPALAPLLTKTQLDQAIKAQKVPLSSLVEIAHFYGIDEHPRKGITLLEPFFADPITQTDELHEFALIILCNLYDDIGFENKKMALLQRIVHATPRSPLRAGAWQRLATIFIDEGYSDEAWDAFHNAQRDNPDSIDIGVLEVQLLISEHQSEQAQERAKFWTKRLQRQGLPEDHGALQFLKAVISNPEQAMGQAAVSMIDEELREFHVWVTEACQRPIGTSPYQVEVIPAPDDEGSMLMLTPSKAIADIEKNWAHAFPLEKPFSTQSMPYTELDIWEPALVVTWISFLKRHPDAIDSLSIIDDVVSAYFLHDQSEIPWLDDMVLAPLLQRAQRIIEQTLATSAPAQLSWLMMENRPALRCLARLISLYARQEDETKRSELCTRLLELNPNDNHGFRLEQINSLLIAWENEKALELADHYPDDMYPDTLFGKVLALVRLGRLDEAQKALAIADERLPKTIRYLTNKRVKKPKIDYDHITFGGDDQAWIYREEMKAIWDESPEALEFIKEHARRSKK